MSDRGTRLLLLASVFAVATCGLIYELICGTLASYLLGDSVTQFSTVIGVYLFAMGIGSYLSRFVQGNVLRMFIRVEYLIGVVGGSAAAILFLCFAHVSSFRVLLYGLIVVVGTMVGLEIPLMLRILKGRLEFKELVSKVFTFDYIGALAASLLFPLLLVPHLGLVRSGFLFGIVNAAVGLCAVEVLRRELGGTAGLRAAGWTAIILLGAGFAASDRIMTWSESATYVDDVIYARSSPYQRVVLTRSTNDLRLYLNGNLQFSSRDEYRYHEALVHAGLARLPQARRVLILGGGDGLAAREVLRYPGIEHITLVDLDPSVTGLFSRQENLVALNGGALSSPKLQIVNADAFAWLRGRTDQFDFVVVDFPDPSNFSVGKLYTTAFFDLARGVLAPGGAMVVQCTSPFVARKSFWCVDATLHAAKFVTEPYHVYVPSFGEWGFILASREPLGGVWQLPEGLRYLTPQTLATLFAFPPDMGPVPTEVNRLNNQALVRYFEEEWAHYVH
ncbi:polyamine aminopropyltransferase [Opitutaceae bacterium EW11]|nr:polyamine aminopropyltransferase [Opitutaceae bacterium EW11]